MATLAVVPVQGVTYTLPDVDPQQVRSALDMIVRAKGPQFAFVNRSQALLIVPVSLVAHIKIDGEIIHECAQVQP
jgi:hypothetical protein